MEVRFRVGLHGDTVDEPDSIVTAAVSTLPDEDYDLGPVNVAAVRVKDDD